MLFNAILFIVSFILFLLSPKEYDETIILFDLAIFLLGSINQIRKTRKNFNILSFNVIFLLSFFFCTYSYALFVIGAGVEFSMTVFGFTDFNYITKAVSLSTIAITVYFIAYSYKKSRNPINTVYIENANVFKQKLIGRLRSLLALGVMVNAFLYISSGNEGAAITTAAFVPEIYKVFLIIYLILKRSTLNQPKFEIIDFILLNKRALVESVVICLLFFIVGDRGLPISIVFIYLGIFSFFYKKINIAQFAVLAIAGVLFLFAIRVTRASENSFANGGVSAVASTTGESLSGGSAILVFSDLMGASCELCLGYEYVDKYGLQYPGKVFLLPLQPFPFLPSIFARFIWGKVPYDLAAGSILNDYISKRYGYNSALGNHIVADIYMHWGLLGVVFFFFCLGYCISKLERNKYANMFWTCSFILALSYALYLPRDSIFTLLRPILFIWLFDKFFHLTKKIKT